ncbi:hypothetical protein ESCNG_60021 [Neisseria gonorrhoeae]|uniref:Uncharacterized protein n=1 Tax=Neisseria gonorrhoeae TaxID=485 RepID=A0AB74EU94_NEIGO|nr:hypothetical protein ESCNG_110038 [Neisseria gonorrhoeae]SCW12604.1 hypothetical protein ESCNG_190014 [Neisseria gonorrhoeae]SCW14731.1 hypothetical protein ESCNG_40064 [Neisseria gonorrhoeae]SCW17501.1 hypothetical protein ESCNG_60021 [Neisseria gonorrhoeae]SCW17966.1 hypothetical protein ESCNG_60060 [Neisseria gonorrhoeae]
MPVCVSFVEKHLNAMYFMENNNMIKK